MKKILIILGLVIGLGSFKELNAQAPSCDITSLGGELLNSIILNHKHIYTI